MTELKDNELVTPPVRLAFPALLRQLIRRTDAHLLWCGAVKIVPFADQLPGGPARGWRVLPKDELGQLGDTCRAASQQVPGVLDLTSGRG